MHECEAVNGVKRHELLQEEPEFERPLSRIHFYLNSNLALGSEADQLLWSITPIQGKN